MENYSQRAPKNRIVSPPELQDIPLNGSKGNGGAKARKSLFTQLQERVKTPELFNTGVPSRYFERGVLLVVLLLLYIYNGHISNKMVVRLGRLKTEVEDLKVDYQTKKSEYMYLSKQSEVARNVANQSIEESSNPPKKVSVRASSLSIEKE